MDSARPASRWYRIERWMTAHEVERTGRTGPRGALVRVGLVYLLGFGMPVVAAIRYLTSEHVRVLSSTRGGWSVLVVLELSLVGLALVVGVALLAREAPGWTRPIAPGSRVRAELKAFGLVWIALVAGSITARLIGSSGYPDSHDSAAAWPSVINSVLAGPGEEIVVLAVPLVLLRAAKWSWWQVVAAALVLRIAYHVYYGWAALGLMVWAFAVIFVYLRSHAIIGMILAHSYWDLSITIGWYWSRDAAAVMQNVVFLTLVVWGLVSLVRGLVRRVRRRRAARVAAQSVGWYQNDTGHWWWWDGQNWFAQPPPGDA